MIYDKKVINMKVNIHKSKVKGTIKVPASKSYSHRYLLAAMLSNSASEISNLYFSHMLQHPKQAHCNLITGLMNNKINTGIWRERARNICYKPLKEALSLLTELNNSIKFT